MEQSMTMREAKHIMSALRVPTQPDEYPRDLYPVALAAAMANMNPEVVYRKIRQRQIHAYGFKGCLKVSLRDLLPVYEPKGRGQR